ncbi:SDR family oxidoreductase [Bradyrhizobium sp. Tv2a-2]|uniref:SDR family oxidoreductase n=1 Tax=Bradyrhizobium sp. Tv2a-2 TaxID=113395 RepID=UPI0004630590|nr:SDR family oxidoreductase [Bradyrhizobium sp. Tv2a-2]
MPIPKVILITGASSGIGEATARHLAKLGNQVVLGARRLERIEKIAGEIASGGGDAMAQKLDVTTMQSIRDFVAVGHTRYGRVDVLVNNAGVMPLSFLAELRVDEWNQMIDVNLRGTLYTLAAALPIMLAQRSGHIINVASVSAYRADPTAAVYSATKFAVRALSEGLRQESKDVRVTVVSPGLTRTELFDGIASQDARAFAKQMVAQSSIAPSAIAEAIGFAISQPDGVDVNELVVRPTSQN